ncbi:hypothetical protein [Mitsuaria sp. 7]|uniref:hypothetical protein n=1 Tax=Mitsuaria sp. 7 TaxID=1658665 RepID=UPI0007DE26E4|nr:hypothetical protein [Mitsuaria sp. 7]ANH68648.1 hypothetical protein ABE85_15650 [Mitsuaria sp. 7]
MRILNQEELELITGGTTLDSVYVGGQHPEVPWEPPYIPDQPGDTGGSGGGNEGGGGGGGGGDDDTYEPPCTCAHPVGTEHTEPVVDAFAAKVARDILAKPNASSVEYMSIIYRRADGSVGTTSMASSGQMDSVSNPEIQRVVNEAGGLQNIIGLVHNHPMAIVNDSNDTTISLKANKMPSTNDWNTAGVLFQGRTDPNYALYVVGPDNVLREYDYKDRAVWEQRVDTGYIRRSPNAALGESLSLQTPPPQACPKHP